jgi:hypothetical protein
MIVIEGKYIETSAKTAANIDKAFFMMAGMIKDS